ncbi:threonine synthase [Pseudogracilibacillus sp. SO30301A]|uniref:threonine synthase n=1 Tax=Pseudogracilibacillus sp. SO30301A TaxID=3098291 RepID=UPI00300E341C
MVYSEVSHLECSKCKAKYEHNQVLNLCKCGKPLFVKYYLDNLANEWNKDSLKNREPSLWRYHELLPIVHKENVVSLGEGMTPLLRMDQMGSELHINDFYLKDESIIPSGTFKSRGAAVGVSKAKELGIQTIAMPTNGNAGASWAAYATRAGIKTKIVMPESAPTIPRNECFMTDADLYLVDGLISDAGQIIGKAVQKYDWFDASTLKEPYRIEGKKTMGLEVLEQLNWEIPDVILYPAGGGVGVIGIYKAILELQEIGWITEKLPRFVVVQSDGCAPIVRAWEENKRESDFWEDAETVAFGITVPKALGDFLVLDILYNTDGCAMAISDDDMLKEQKHLAAMEGIYICPEGATTIAATRKLRENGWIKQNDKVVAINTGSGIKYPEIVESKIPMLQKDEEL